MNRFPPACRRSSRISWRRFPSDLRLLSLRVEKETGFIWATFVVANEEGWFYAIEHWDGCQYEGSTDWMPAER